MLQLRDVLQFVVYRLDDSPLANEDFVGDAHMAVLHVVPHPGYQLYPVSEQLMALCYSFSINYFISNLR